MKEQGLMAFWHLFKEMHAKNSIEKPNFAGYTSLLKNNQDTEYQIAKAIGKLSRHFQKWRFYI